MLLYKLFALIESRIKIHFGPVGRHSEAAVNISSKSVNVLATAGAHIRAASDVPAGQRLSEQSFKENHR